MKSFMYPHKQKPRVSSLVNRVARHVDFHNHSSDVHSNDSSTVILQNEITQKSTELLNLWVAELIHVGSGMGTDLTHTIPASDKQFGKQLTLGLHWTIHSTSSWS
jgi:hypothetical protein